MAIFSASLQSSHVLAPVQVHQARRTRCRSTRSVIVRAFQGTERGASGLDVKGLRPTSPAAWAIMRDTLRSRKVSSQQFSADLLKYPQTVPEVSSSINFGLCCQPRQEHLSEADEFDWALVQVQMLSQQELVFALDKEIPIIDIRPPDEFKAGHIKGCVSLTCTVVSLRVQDAFTDF